MMSGPSDSPVVHALTAVTNCTSTTESVLRTEYQELAVPVISRGIIGLSIIRYDPDRNGVLFTLAGQPDFYLNRYSD